MPVLRFVVGMLVAPFSAAVFYVALVTAQYYVFGLPPPSSLELGSWVLLACIYSYPTGWLLGLPSYVVYQRLGLNSLVSYVIGGLTGGCLFAGWFVLPFPQSPEVWLPMVVSASLSCAVFWLVAVPRRTSYLTRRLSRRRDSVVNDTILC